MPRVKQPCNPFYVALVIVAVTFSITACAYCAMALKSIAAAPELAEDSSGGLMDFLDRHGGKLMAIELVLLGIASIGAIGTDQYWLRPTTAAQSLPPRRRQDRET